MAPEAAMLPIAFTNSISRGDASSAQTKCEKSVGHEFKADGAINRIIGPWRGREKRTETEVNTISARRLDIKLT